MMDYKLLKALAAVVREHGFERASKQLHITQSAVSQRVRLLEEQTGQILLARTHPPRATPAGQRMIKHYLQVKRLEDDLLNAMLPERRGRFATLPVGLNSDSLATWFPEAVAPFLKKESVLLDLKSDDQDQTHRLLKNGDVIGCVSAKAHPIRGCRMDYLGRMDYRMLATPDFAAQWFPDGFIPESISLAPLVVFNRQDTLHLQFFRRTLKDVPTEFPAHYLPSSEKFADYIAKGLAYGMLPDQQSEAYLKNDELSELVPDASVPVRLYWHRWNLKSKLLEKFSEHLISEAKKYLNK